MGPETVENNKDYSEADGTDEHTATTRLHYGLLFVGFGLFGRNGE